MTTSIEGTHAMTSFPKILTGLLLLGLAGTAAAQTQPGHAHDAAKPAATAATDVPAAAAPAVAVVERFGKALKAGDLKAAGALLDTNVMILESGGVERSREEYLGHHAISDAAFLKNAHVQLQRRTARIDGPLAWVGSASELHTRKDGKPLTLLSTETMVLRQSGVDWRIVHIHWSSRPKPAAKASAEQATQPDVHRQHPVNDGAALLAGEGAGQSLVAERRGVPGPRHVLEHSDALALSDAQRVQVTRIHAGMRQRAVALGQAVVAAEAELDRLFAASPIDSSAIAAQVAHVGTLRAQLRQVHLDAHLATLPQLTQAQRIRYVALRSGAGHDHRE
jgi:Spy/CpxP family protein refolding chaperone